MRGYCRYYILYYPMVHVYAQVYSEYVVQPIGVRQDSIVVSTVKILQDSIVYSIYSKAVDTTYYTILQCMYMDRCTVNMQCSILMYVCMYAYACTRLSGSINFSLSLSLWQVTLLSTHILTFDNLCQVAFVANVYLTCIYCVPKKGRTYLGF